MVKEAKNVDIVVYVTWEPRFKMLRNPYINYKEIKKIKGIFSDSKIKILFTLKTKNPKSIYELSKILARDQKSVKKDLKFLEQFGILKLIKEKDKKTKRTYARPVLNTNVINVKFVV